MVPPLSAPSAREEAWLKRAGDPAAGRGGRDCGQGVGAGCGCPSPGELRGRRGRRGRDAEALRATGCGRRWESRGPDRRGMWTHIHPKLVLPTPTPAPRPARPQTAATVCPRPGRGETDRLSAGPPAPPPLGVKERLRWLGQVGGAGPQGSAGCHGAAKVSQRAPGPSPRPTCSRDPSGAPKSGPGLLRRPRDRRALLSSPSPCASATAAVSANALPSRFGSCRAQGRAWICPGGSGGVGVRLWRGGREERPRGEQCLSLVRSPKASGQSPCLWEREVKDSGS